MNEMQARLLARALEIEIRTMKQGYKMQLTREPAMKALSRLAGIDAYKVFGRGIAGRQKAFDEINEMLKDYGLEPVIPISN